ncbi:hypothetical protein ACQ86N_41130 [Puia sp. P3]|uniref:hypothetical protein n=1 Tax=Puia sp. P3 TaxID=3423952 RepID=UPI003D669659
MMNKKDYGLWFLLGASILMSLPYAPPFTFIIDDIEFFRYTGMAILKGQVPYRDFFDHKPPMIYFINAAGQALGGWWGLWLISTLFALVITWLFYRLCRQYRLTFPWVLPLLFNLMIRDNLVSEGMHYTREYSTFFVMLFFIALMGKSKYRYFLIGLFAALTFFTQQDQILLLIPFLLYAVISNDELTFFTRCLQTAAGFLSVTALLILYFAINHSLSWFWNDSFAFNFTVYIHEKKSIGDHFRTIKRVLDKGNYELPVMVAISLGITSLFVQNKKRPSSPSPCFP